MLEYVGDRLLDDPVGGKIHRRGQPALVARHLQRRLKSCIPRRLEERVDVVKCWLRHKVGGARALAKDTEELVQLTERVPRALLDGFERLFARVARDPRGAGLDRHHAHVVGDDVMQFARDAQALSLRSLFPLLLVARHQLGEECAPRAHVVADDPRDERKSAGGDDKTHGLEVTEDQENDRDEDHHHRGAGDEDPHARAVVHRDGVDGEGEPQT